MFEMKCYYGTFKNKRENNEDNFYINSVYAPVNHNSDIKGKASVTDGKQAFFGVFDGLGGEEKGEAASYTAARALKSYTDINKYYFAANKAVANLSPGRTGRSGSTAVILEFSNGMFQCSNLGDSRGYLIRNGKIYRLSRDHTTIQTLIENGTLTEEEARKSRFKNSLSQCLGPEEDDTEISPYYSKKSETKDGDIFLLCSDGLTGSLTDDEIKNIILTSKGEEAVETLFKKAEAAGAKDNTTVVLIYAQKEKNSSAPAAAAKSAPKSAPKQAAKPSQGSGKPSASRKMESRKPEPKKKNSFALIMAGISAAVIIICFVVLYLTLFNSKEAKQVSEPTAASAENKIKSLDEAFQDVLYSRTVSGYYLNYDINKDGTEELVFSEKYSGLLEVYVYEAETGETKQLTADLQTSPFDDEESFLFDYSEGLGYAAVECGYFTIENDALVKNPLDSSFVTSAKSSELSFTPLSGQIDPTTTTTTETTTETTTQAPTEATTRKQTEQTTKGSYTKPTTQAPVIQPATQAPVYTEPTTQASAYTEPDTQQATQSQHNNSNENNIRERILQEETVEIYSTN